MRSIAESVPSAVRPLESRPRDDGNPWVIARKQPDSHLTHLQHPWRRIRPRADLGDVRTHDLRHSHASIALQRGETALTIAKLLGRRNGGERIRLGAIVGRRRAIG